MDAGVSRGFCSRGPNIIYRTTTIDLHALDTSSVSSVTDLGGGGSQGSVTA